MRASEHLLRTLASVAPTTKVLDVDCGSGARVVPLAQLGFSVTATDCDAARLDVLRGTLDAEGLSAHLADADAAHLPFPDDAFDWVVADRVLDGCSLAEQLDLLAEWRRVLAPGGWLYLTADPATPLKAVESLLARARFERSEAPRIDPVERVVRGIFRRVEEDTVG